MPFRLRCPCGKVLQVPETLAGKVAKCPGCAKVFRVPAPKAASAPSAPAATSPPAPAGPECPSCHRVLPPGSTFCVGCGFDLKKGKAVGPTAVSEADPDEAPRTILPLVTGTILRPASTMEVLLIHLSSGSLLAQAILLYAAALGLMGWAQAAGGGSFAGGSAGFLVDTVASAAAISLAGSLLGEGGNFLPVLVTLVFVRSVTISLGAALILLLSLGLGGSAAAIILIPFLIWLFVLNLLVITSAYGVSGGMAFLISLVAGLISRFLGVWLGAAL